MAGSILFSGHAIQRMFERQITVDQVKNAIAANDVIATYPDDKPLPSRLLIFNTPEGVIHVVTAFDVIENREVVISVYRPDPLVWNEDKRSRK